MKKIIAIFFSLAMLISACSDNDDNSATPEIPVAPSADKIVLNQPIHDGESIKLVWSVLDNINFAGYYVMRRNSPDQSFVQLEDRLFDKDATSIVDMNSPYSPEVSYQIRAQLRDGSSIYSNIVSHKTAGVNLLNINPYDVIYRSEEQLLYFFEKGGRVTLYDLKADKISKQIETQATIGYADIEIFQGKKELYIPRNDGWIFVYDALTLEKIAQITVGLESSCVVSSNNILYVSTSGWTRQPLKVYQRADRRLIAETGDHDLTRFRKVPGSNTKLLEVTLNVGPTDQRFYDFTAQGSILNQFSDRYHGDYALDASIFAFFPNGTKYVTAKTGAIYNIDLSYDKSLPRGNLEFADFCFSTDGKEIFAATTGKKIEAYSTQDYTYLRSIKTKAYPYKIFKTADGILSISTMSNEQLYYFPNANNNKVVIEKITL